MKHFREALVAVAGTSLLLVAATLPVTTAQAKTPPSARSVTDWSSIALRTVYGQARLPVPVGSLYLGFTSLAVYDAVLDASKANPRHGRASAPAAAAVAAHDVLAQYVPAYIADLDADLAADLAAIPASPAKSRGIALGSAAADDLIASRVGDGRGAAITYAKPPSIGIWRPTPPANAPMALPWLGFVKPLLLDSPTQIHVDGPDALGSASYATDFEEVRAKGALTGSTRTPAETVTARFYNYNAVLQLENALIGFSTTHPDDIVTTARTFALTNASIADALITTWRLKYDVGYWRPVTAIRQADLDGNPGTTPDPDWVPFADSPLANPPGAPVGTPNYPEYPSGHASITNAFTESLALSFGTRTTDLALFSGVTGTTRGYTDLDSLSTDAFNARIWLGIHFRDAMEDAVYIGAESARLADQRLP
ncbi:MAG: vanadium-dependent haloperoxidase [Nocardioidaceae bacterium]|nr:vanadium-dependent haloperoxidase [Nocardioidaceae bacterium]